MIPIILSGGSGARLWPLSRKSTPKQFLSLHGENTLFQETVVRLKKLDLADPIVVCNKDHRFTVANNLEMIDYQADEIILEPMGRNTAPAIAVAALRALENHKDPIILVLPADHEIQNEEALARSFKIAKTMAEKDFLVTFGIEPKEAHTGYGYIKVGDQLGICSSEVDSFIEKPNKEKAEELIEEGGYLWNSGMFCFKASRYIEELERFEPELVEYAKKSMDASLNDFDFVRLNPENFEKCNNISIDFAVMERTDRACVVSIDAQWNDIGAWDAVWEVSKKDGSNNVCNGDTMEEDSYNNFLYSKDKLLVALGVDNLIVVNTPDAVLVASKNHANQVKTIVDNLKALDRDEVKHHELVDMSWGNYKTLHSGDISEVKRISVKPKSKLMSQEHSYKSEHWIILRGEARVTRGGEVVHLSTNESIHIAEGVIHSFENIGEDTLEMIEVKSGDDVEENNIIRING